MYLVDTEAVGTSGVHRFGLLYWLTCNHKSEPLFRPFALLSCWLDSLESFPSCRGVQEREIAILDALGDLVMVLFGLYPCRDDSK